MTTSLAEPPHNHFRHSVATALNATATTLISLVPTPKTTLSSTPPFKICTPFPFADSPLQVTSLSSESTRSESISSNSSIRSVSSAESTSGSGFPSTVRIAGLNSGGKGGGPAFVGQVFSMCDLSGTGLMAVSTHFDIPFISKRTPEWLKRIFSSITKSERNGPVFRFFMDLGDAVSYVKQLNIPSGVVGACRLDLAYEHFKEKPHLFQFVPNEKQVKAANKLLKKIPQNGGMKKVNGVPVFGAQNLDIAIATSEGIKWYTPYFFDKGMLDNILEESVDQHFDSLVQTRHMQRRRDVIDDNLPAEVIEEMGDSVWEPPEVQEVLDEIGHPAIPLSVISKAAEIQLLHVVDKVVLGNRWLRKATGIQPKFPYVVDSFERRSAASLQRAYASSNCLANVDSDQGAAHQQFEDDTANHGWKTDFRFPFQNWFRPPWGEGRSQQGFDERLEGASTESMRQNFETNTFLPKITMVGVSTTEGQMSKSRLKKTMEELTKDLEKTDQGNAMVNNRINEVKDEDRDPLFVANVGDYYSGLAKTGSARWVRGGHS